MRAKIELETGQKKKTIVNLRKGYVFMLEGRKGYFHEELTSQMLVRYI